MTISTSVAAGKKVNPDLVVVDAVLRWPPQEVMQHFKVRVPVKPEHSTEYGVVVKDLGFAKMIYTFKHGVHFACALRDFPELIKELQAYLKRHQVPRINEMGLATIVFTPSEYCAEFSQAADKANLEGNRWDVFKNHFMTYTL